ncbi:Rv1355c family protein [Phytoactinopolyspora mesophila]|uniref:Rv1355c family protein n=1 Tax=Phytoactinopolyspora mesophila TaxID=2650750 RepID=A0A7K3M092_9ACTN|nr:Rv1355c family protein [Phytoactinopolyspora mesophila]NDL56713.1 Rv1355c family protein [Phytoactinopolyspora mesophila]
MTQPVPDDTEAWRPVHVHKPSELSRLSADPHTKVFDRVDQQRRDLARVLPYPDPRHLDEPTRWYYYPWRRSMVHLLGPEAFQALRSDRNRNKLTADEQQRLRQLTIGVVGLSVGHAIAHTLALEGICREIRLADFDEIELSNLNRIPASVFDLGLNKAVAAARRIAEIDPYIEVSIDPSGVSLDSTDTFMTGLDIVIEECDSFDVKLAVRDAARRHQIPLIMETNDRGLLDIERYDLEPDRPLFHGLLGDTKASELMGLSTRDKVPYILRILEADKLSARVLASMTEIDETVSTWPQLGGDIQLGAAVVSAAVRRIGLGQPLRSGRVRVDLHEALDRIAEPARPMATDAHDVSAEPEEAPAVARDAVVHAARLAPSGGNTQPWTFTADDSNLLIHLDPEQTSTLDVAFRASYVGIGAALFNARVAAARHGILGPAEVFAHAGDASPVARLAFADAADDELAKLYEPMLRRVSNRRVSEPRQLPEHVVPELRRAAEREGAEAVVVTDREQLRELAELYGESDRIRFLTDHLHHEMMRELRWPGVDDLDWGLDVRTLELDASDLAKLGVARRSDVMAVLAEQDLGRALGEMSRTRIESTSGFVIVTVDGADPADYVRGGQAVERTWIQAEQLGLAVQAMSPVFIYAVDSADYGQLSVSYAEQLRSLHRKFNQLTGIGNQQIALTMRIGYAPSISARSRRRPAERIVRVA